MYQIKSVSIILVFLFPIFLPISLQQSWPADYDVSDGESFTFIVVGAGSAGAVVARRLAEQSDWRVLLLEAGTDPDEFSVVPALGDLLKHTSYDWDYYSENDGYSSQAIVNGTISFNRGKMLGGCSSINNMYYVRGNRGDYNNWADIVGDSSWEWENVLPYFAKAEGMQDITLLTSYLHNATGPVLISKPNRDYREQNKISVLLESFENIGINVLAETNGEEQLGVAIPHFTHSSSGIRSSTAQAYLTNTTDNLFIVKNATVTKIIIEDLEAQGVEFIRNGEVFNVFSKNDVILSAGAFNTPKILIASGIGPEEDLNRLNIESLVYLPVGSGLQDHLTIPIVIAAANATDRSPGNILNYGPIPSVQGFFMPDENNVPQFQLLTFYFNVTSPILFPSCSPSNRYATSICDGLVEINTDHEIFFTFIILLHPKSTGKVVINSVDEDAAPEIHTGYFSDSEDQKSILEAINKFTELVKTSYFNNSNAFVVKLNFTDCDDYEFMSDDYWKCYSLYTANTIHHSASTAAMGSVVDSNLDVLGVTSLKIADTSVFPTMTSGNTNAPAMMVGEKTADIIKKKYLNEVSVY